MFIKYLSNFPLDAVQSGALLAVFVSFFYFTGAALVSVLTKADNMRPENTADFFLPNTAVGIILFGTLFFIAGSTAGVNAGNLLGMFAASTLVSAVIMKGAGVRLFGIISDTNSGQAAIFIKLSILAILSVSLVKALAPPTGNDAMAYHLLHPMQYLDAHKIYDIQTDRESLWPYLTEMLYTAGLYVKGFSLAKLFHWMFFPLCLASVYRIAKDIHSEESAWMAVLFSALIPVVFNQSGVAYVDLSLAFYFLVPQIMLAYSVSAKRDYSILIGVLLGGLLAIKYLGIGACASIVLAWWIVARMRLKSILTISLWVIAVSGFWYVRSWLLRGNPVYPFFYEAFNGNGFPLTLRDSYEIGSGFYDYLITPFRMTAFP
ncbi:MAG: hypothetical protein KC649_03355, partial [Candidatus Omnitrophica bacterium]|nr:hypothetical protein [Candidatus Omnitrophota bacterium]